MENEVGGSGRRAKLLVAVGACLLFRTFGVSLVREWTDLMLNELLRLIAL